MHLQRAQAKTYSIASITDNAHQYCIAMQQEYVTQYKLYQDVHELWNHLDMKVFFLSTLSGKDGDSKST